MAPEVEAEGTVDVVTGQVIPAPAEPTSLDASATSTGQPDAGEAKGTTDAGTHEPAVEAFFNPEDIKDKPELMAAYKQMQSAFTKKTQGLKDMQKKVEAFDAFQTDPIGQMQRIAEQHGYKLTRPNSQPTGDFEPQTWDDVVRHVKGQLFNELSPMLNEIKTMKQTSIEKMLDDSAPDWRQYEDDMRTVLQKHPTLVNDPVKLYQMSIPPEVLESRATQAALKRLQQKAESSKTSGISTTKAKPQTELPDRPVSFSEAVAAAKASLAEQGIRTGA